MIRKDRISVKHTPGPWEVTTPNGKKCGWSIGPAWLGRNAGTPQGEADALLISAAPDLLEALDGLVSACELPGDHCEVEQALPAAIAALKKAVMP